MKIDGWFCNREINELSKSGSASPEILLAQERKLKRENLNLCFRFPEIFWLRAGFFFRLVVFILDFYISIPYN